MCVFSSPAGFLKPCRLFFFLFFRWSFLMEDKIMCARERTVAAGKHLSCSRKGWQHQRRHSLKRTLGTRVTDFVLVDAGQGEPGHFPEDRPTAQLFATQMEEQEVRPSASSMTPGGGGGGSLPLSGRTPRDFDMTPASVIASCDSSAPRTPPSPSATTAIEPRRHHLPSWYKTILRFLPFSSFPVHQKVQK